jgi:hypothetical protein
MARLAWRRSYGKFGSKAEELGVIRGKLLTYTSAISVILDTMQIRAADRVESKIDEGSPTWWGNLRR